MTHQFPAFSYAGLKIVLILAAQVFVAAWASSVAESGGALWSCQGLSLRGSTGGPPPDDLPSYSANYSDDFKTWRPVEISRLVSKQQNKISDGRICASAAAPKTCSIERVLRKTGRFQKWLQAKRLTPDLVRVSVLAVGGRRTEGTSASLHLSLSGQKQL